MSRGCTFGLPGQQQLSNCLEVKVRGAIAIQIDLSIERTD